MGENSISNKQRTIGKACLPTCRWSFSGGARRAAGIGAGKPNETYRKKRNLPGNCKTLWEFAKPYGNSKNPTGVAISFREFAKANRKRGNTSGKRKTLRETPFPYRKAGKPTGNQKSWQKLITAGLHWLISNQHTWISGQHRLVAGGLFITSSQHQFKTTQLQVISG